GGLPPAPSSGPSPPWRRAWCTSAPPTARSTPWTPRRDRRSGPDPSPSPGSWAPPWPTAWSTWARPTATPTPWTPPPGTCGGVSPLGGGIFASPAVADGVMYVSSSQADTQLYALDAATGAKLW